MLTAAFVEPPPGLDQGLMPSALGKRLRAREGFGHRDVGLDQDFIPL
jgi:hypothetical protein